MKKYIRYVLILLAVVAFGILYSCERQEGNVEVIESDDKSNMSDSTEALSQAYEEAVNTICIHVTGCVVNPGVYQLPEGSRVYEVIVLAGGFTDEADRDYVNQASVLCDGQKLHIYSSEETETASQYTESNTDENKSGLININTASKTELMNLPGIGESRAESIIAYREENGGFKAIEDIMKVSGIKDAAFNKIKEYICTN